MWYLPRSVRMRRARIYADENIEDEAIEFLRSQKVSVLSARELGYAGRGDGFHLNYARSKGRYLLTKDEDFLNDRKFPLNNVPGIIVLAGDMSRMVDYNVALNLILTQVVPFGSLHSGQKIQVSASRISFRFVLDGQIVDEEYRTEDRRWYTLERSDR